MTDILIVILIFAVILIWSEMGIRRIIKAKKYKEELVETRINDCKKEYDNFVEKYSNDPILSKSNWFGIKKRYLKRFLDKMDDENVFLFAFEVSEKLDLVTEDFFTMVEIISNIEKEVEDVKTNIIESIKKFELYKNNDIPKFFVIESLTSNEKYYCFSTNLKINEKTLDICGLVFYSSVKEGYFKTFSPYNVKIRKMTKEEFDNEYLPNRLTNMKFDGDIQASMYENYLKTMFENDK
jgi:hypothetical protein